MADLEAELKDAGIRFREFLFHRWASLGVVPPVAIVRRLAAQPGDPVDLAIALDILGPILGLNVPIAHPGHVARAGGETAEPARNFGRWTQPRWQP